MVIHARAYPTLSMTGREYDRGENGHGALGKSRKRNGAEHRQAA